MDSNVSAISNNGPVPSAPLSKPKAVIEKDLKQKRKELLQRLHPFATPRLEPTLYQHVNNPDMMGLINQENQLMECILHFQEDIKKLEASINTELHKIDVTNTEGGNFLPGEEEIFDIPQWT